MKKSLFPLSIGILIGATLFGGSAAYAAGIMAERCEQLIYVDGSPVRLESCLVGGHNYVKLRDIGEAVGFNVYWNDGIYIDSTAPYTGEAAPVVVTESAPYIPEVGDTIRCDDGTDHTITDVSRYDKNAFASGPVGTLPEPACDWNSFPAVELPAPEARRYRLENGDYLFIRNLYESRRMQYTIQNLAGNHPDTGENGKLNYSAKGTPSVRIQLTIPADKTPQVFWPWRASELERIFESCPPGTYCMEAWDVYKDGIFQRTEYSIYAF